MEIWITALGIITAIVSCLWCFLCGIVCLIKLIYQGYESFNEDMIFKNEEDRKKT